MSLDRVLETYVPKIFDRKKRKDITRIKQREFTEVESTHNKTSTSPQKSYEKHKKALLKRLDDQLKVCFKSLSWILGSCMAYSDESS